MQVWNIGGIQFGGRKLDRQTAKFNSLPNFQAIRYLVKFLVAVGGTNFQHAKLSIKIVHV